MSKNRYTARIQDIRLSQIAHQRRGEILFRFDINELISQRRGQMAVGGVSLNTNRLETAPDDINNRGMWLAKRTLRREGKQ